MDFEAKPYALAYTGVVVSRLRLHKWALDAASFIHGVIFDEPRHSRLQGRRGCPLAPPKISSEYHEILDRVIFDLLSKRSYTLPPTWPSWLPASGSINGLGIPRGFSMGHFRVFIITNLYTPAYKAVVVARFCLQK
ncbi:hypothetical protein B0H10DRAFT_1941135 [Mycena sp. CBHHK59/15]|nr:hypothetical protein B0H10DRAFT_1952116 [Mycena sp. CBHHK59/15]KAJ6627375.1 hypothetical protein B0H10DRAFT_1941135 [Mycena sp. CBHHK59/15]